MNFHSFRHTFGTSLSHNGLNDHHLKTLMGHAEKGTTFNTYVKKTEIPMLHDELVKHLEYVIDLEALKRSKWSKLADGFGGLIVVDGDVPYKHLGNL